MQLAEYMDKQKAPTAPPISQVTTPPGGNNTTAPEAPRSRGNSLVGNIVSGIEPPPPVPALPAVPSSEPPEVTVITQAYLGEVVDEAGDT